MLKPKKKITKKEIKQDGLINAYAQVTSYYYENKKYISYALTAIVVIAIATYVYINNRRANNEKAASEIAKVYAIYDGAASNNAQYKTAIDGIPERGIMGLKNIVDNYGGTESGELARFYLANSYFGLHQYDEALKCYDDFSGGDKFLQASALAGVGACYESKGEFAKAASAYEKAVGKYSSNATSPDYMNSAARCYGRSGEKEKAVTLYKRLKKEFPTSAFARDAERYITQFSI
jgi:tetratricopeptide (TPR) repeat protein